MGKLTVQDLVKHLETYKDALLLIGDKAVILKGEADSDILTNKNLRRNPTEFWKHYFEAIYADSSEDMSQAQKAVAALKNKDLIRNIVNLTTDSKLNVLGDVINLHGESDKFKCTSCKTIFTDDYVKTCPEGAIECEVCGRPLRPMILLNGENYYDDQYNAFKHLLLETHTLFVVGLDWGETPIVNLIADYAEMKDNRNASEEEQRMVVVVGTDDFINIEEVGQFEFVVPGDVNESMKRLLLNI